MKRILYEGKVTRDPDGMNGGPFVMIVGTSRDLDHPECISGGTYHGRFLLTDDLVGRYVRITVEIE